MAKLSRRPRKLGEAVTRKQAIRNHCFECVGYQMAEVRRCCSQECWLYPYRTGSIDEEEMQKEKQLAKEEKKRQREERKKKKETKK